MCTVLGLFLFLYRSLDDVARARQVDWTSRFVEEMSGGYTIFILIWPISRFMLRFPITGHFRTRVPLYAAAGVIYGLLATTSMYAARLCIFYLLGRGIYDYGVLPGSIRDGNAVGTHRVWSCGGQPSLQTRALARCRAARPRRRPRA
jgi:hypothetical protein